MPTTIPKDVITSYTSELDRVHGTRKRTEAHQDYEKRVENTKHRLAQIAEEQAPELLEAAVSAAYMSGKAKEMRETAGTLLDYAGMKPSNRQELENDLMDRLPTEAVMAAFQGIARVFGAGAQSVKTIQAEFTVKDSD